MHVHQWRWQDTPPACLSPAWSPTGRPRIYCKAAYFAKYHSFLVYHRYCPRGVDFSDDPGSSSPSGWRFDKNPRSTRAHKNSPRQRNGRLLVKCRSCRLWVSVCLRCQGGGTSPEWWCQPAEQETLPERWCNVGPASKTPAQHYARVWATYLSRLGVRSVLPVVSWI